MDKKGIEFKDTGEARMSRFSTFGLGKEKEYFIDNLTMLLTSGMDILLALEAIKSELRSKQMKRVVDSLKSDINEGSPIWRALKKTNFLPDHVISLIRIGEETGRLSKNLSVVAVQQKKEREFRSKIRSAMAYPVLVLAITMVVGIGVAWFILPRLDLVFNQLKLDLPLISEALISLGKFLGEFGSIAIPIVVVIIVAGIYFLFFNPKTKFLGQAVLFGMPGIRKLIQEVEISHFGYILGTLLQAGLPIVSAVRSLEETASFKTYRNLYKFLGDSLEDGNSFQKSFLAYGKIRKLVPAPIQEMIITGERSGNLPETLVKIGDIFEGKTDTTTKNLAIILEPILLVIVWVGVVLVAMAVILPIYSLIGGLQTGPQSVQTPEPEANTLLSDSGFSTNSNETLPTLRIVKTELEHLNIRDFPSIDGDLVGMVYPEETYEYTDQKDGWYEIVLPDGEKGWIWGAYVETTFNN